MRKGKGREAGKQGGLKAGKQEGQKAGRPGSIASSLKLQRLTISRIPRF